MRLRILLVIFISLLPFATTASAEPYVGFNIGASFTSDSNLSENNTPSRSLSYNSGIALSGVAGLDFGLSRVELETGYRKIDVDRLSKNGSTTILSGSIDIMNYMANGYLALPFIYPVKPFIMAGFGFATMHAGELKQIGATPFSSATNTQFAYQTGLGITYDVSSRIALDAGYRYLGTSDFDLNGTKVGYDSHNLLLGCRYFF